MVAWKNFVESTLDRLLFLQGNVKAQGDLILQDIVLVADHRAKTKPAKRRVFVFEQMIIFSEPFERKKDWTVFIYRHSIKVSKMAGRRYYTRVDGYPEALSSLASRLTSWVWRRRMVMIHASLQSGHIERQVRYMWWKPKLLKIKRNGSRLWNNCLNIWNSLRTVRLHVLMYICTFLVWKDLHWISILVF